MKIPVKIRGFNKLRDAAIVIAWARERLTPKEISEKFNLTQRRIEQIIYHNHDFVTFSKDLEKKKRIYRLEKWLEKNPETSRDSLDILIELRKEIEGEKPLVDNSTHNTAIQYNWLNQIEENNNDSLRSTELSASDTQR